MPRFAVVAAAILTALAAAAAEAETIAGSQDLRRVQDALAARNYDPGASNGVLTARTAAAIRQFEADWRIPETGTVTADLLRMLAMEHPRTSPRWQRLADGRCEVWNPEPEAFETARWNGGCVNGRISGQGRLVWRYRKHGEWRSLAFNGAFSDGKAKGWGAFSAGPVASLVGG